MEVLEVMGKVVEIGICFSRVNKSWVGDSVREHVFPGLDARERRWCHALVLLVLGVVFFAVKVQGFRGGRV
jgi:hypothetical protein